MSLSRTNSCEAAMTKYQLVSFKSCPWVERGEVVLREEKIDVESAHI